MPDALSVYVNWLLYAVLGRLPEADWMMREYGSIVRGVARSLRRAYPFVPVDLHRGLLMEDETMFEPGGREFTSWSESAEVASWFADPRSSMNAFIVDRYPNARGFVLTLERAEAASTSVLFHHSWAKHADLAELARQHPMCGEDGARQIDWALKTQHEVVTDPLATWPARRPYEASADREAIDRRLSPPWSLIEEG